VEIGAGGGLSGSGGWRHDGALSLIGRDEEMALLRSFVDRATALGDAMVLAGAAGVGKTALLDAAVVYAAHSGVRTITATGSQFEVAISFASLQQVVDPFLAHLPTLADPQQTALRGALSLGEGQLTDRLLIAGAARQLLIEAATIDPILLGYHLHQIFPKLGVTSRAALRDALADLPPDRSSDRG
jgi:hypothetical protein